MITSKAKINVFDIFVSISRLLRDRGPSFRKKKSKKFDYSLSGKQQCHFPKFHFSMDFRALYVPMWQPTKLQSPLRISLPQLPHLAIIEILKILSTEKKIRENDFSVILRSTHIVSQFGSKMCHKIAILGSLDAKV